MKVCVVDSYMKKVKKVKDPQIRKQFEKLDQERKRSVPKQLVQVKSTENLKSNVFISKGEKSSIRNTRINKQNSKDNLSILEL